MRIAQNIVTCIKWPVTVLLLLFPIVALVFHNAGNAILLLLLVLSLATLVLRLRPGDIPFVFLLKSYWPLHLAMIASCLAVLLNQAWNGSFAFKFYDRGLRLAIFPLIFWVLFF